MGAPRVDADIIIIGAGAAGLAAGRRARAAGASVLILEARKRIGGRALTQATPLGHPVDLGCEWLHSANLNPWTAIARGMGLRIDERLPDWRSRIARLKGEDAQVDWSAAMAAFEAREHEAAGAASDLSAAELLVQGDPWNALIDAVSTWANGVELDRLSVQDHVRYSDSGVNWRILEGYGATIASYGSGLPVRTAVAVERVDHGGSAVALTTAQGDIRARAVIVTVPPTLLANESIRFLPPLPDKIEAAHGLPLGVANKLFLAVDGAFDFDADRHVLGATDRTATGSYQLRPHGWPMITGFFGGRLATELERVGIRGMTDFALSELAGLFGTDVKRRLRPLAASAWASDPFAVGSYSHALPGHAGDRARLAADVDQRIFFAGEACSACDFSTAHGAFLTGRAAADAAISAIGLAHPDNIGVMN